MKIKLNFKKIFSENIFESRKNLGSSRHLEVKSPKESAKKILSCFNMKSESSDEEKKAILNSISINAAMALHLAEENKSIDECFQIAKENIFNGNALKKLDQLKDFTNRS